MENPYKVLGVESNATNSEITKAYRDLAKKWHPDKNKAPEAPEMFKKINDCYKYLIDEGKREFLDTHGRRMDAEDEAHEEMRSQGGMGQGFPFGPGFPFSQGFPFGAGGMHFAAGPNPEQIKEMKRKQLHIKMNVELSLEQIYTGIKKTLKYPRVRVVKNVQTQEEGEVELDIKAGFASSSHIEIKNKGHILVDNDGSEIIGSVIFVVSEANDLTYERDYKKQENLICKRKISLVEALCGLYLELPHPSGLKLVVETQSVIKPTTQYKIVNKGLPILGRGKSYGDIIFKFEIEYPQTITIEQKEKLEEIFGYKAPEYIGGPGKIHSTLLEHEEDEVDEPDEQNNNGTQSVQCAQS